MVLDDLFDGFGVPDLGRWLADVDDRLSRAVESRVEPLGASIARYDEL